MERSTREASVTGALVAVGFGRVRLVGVDGAIGLDRVVGAEVTLGRGDRVGLVRAGAGVDVQPAAVRAANAPATTYAAGLITPL